MKGTPIGLSSIQIFDASLRRKQGYFAIPLVIVNVCEIYKLDEWGINSATEKPVDSIGKNGIGDSDKFD